MSAALVLRAGPLSVRTTRRMLLVCAALVAVALGLAVWAMTLGSYGLSAGEVIGAFLGTTEGPARKVVIEWRAPRVVAALLFGAALGVSGSIFQSLTRNPLGSPDVIGFSTGSYTGVILMMLTGATGYAAYATGALIGGVLTAVVVYVLAFRRGMQGFRLIIVGIAMGALLGSLNTWFSTRADVDLALRAAVWGAGSLAAVDGTTLGIAAIAIAAVLLCAPAAQRRMRRLELGDDAAAMLGIPLERTRGMLMLLGVAAIAAVTAAAGPIAFVALAAPQIGQRLTGRGTSVDLVGAALTGSVLLLVADVIAQHAIPDVTLPTGAVTICIGGVYLLVLLMRESRRFTGGGRR
ncbi:iron chelate uptake ABC transporter family permease subunit [Microbacterium sp. MYb62]|uniref:FecCD family ABC transporter permease n=1 Tax=Microbacterium sp. MYb62 TaxID=1848690 RepID=UPI000CFDB4A0|nr:iron chelate uptake ABC transporter family permease subunit [Microbacterium sp. MYb62]PRB10612.1 iron ABC transporter permease [Microbacterium sp. MYb62]